MFREFAFQFGPLFIALLLLVVLIRLLTALPGMAWRRWRYHRQRPLRRYAAHVVEAALQFDSRLRDRAVARGTISRAEIDQGLARGRALVQAELRGRG